MQLVIKIEQMPAGRYRQKGRVNRNDPKEREHP